MGHHNSKTPVILLAFANDGEASLRELAIEQDELRTIFRQVERDGKCELAAIAAATAEKVIQAFQEYRGRVKIFHYSGHSNEDEIFFKTVYQQQKGTEAESLAEFLALQQGLELVFLNSCLSLRQAEAYHKAGVKAVIGTDRAIGDKEARKFSGLFYTSLVTGADISRACQEAEKGFQIQFEVISRGAGRKAGNSAVAFPWQAYPKHLHTWRLPMVAKHLTRIPTIDLNKEFFGREADMRRLKDILAHTSKVVLMNGLGGIGKTVLATAYIQQFGNHYDHLAWINRGEDLITSIALNEDLADKLGMPFEQEEELEARFRRILRKLHDLPGRNFLVIDNAQQQIAQKEIYELLPGAPNWRVLLTSRLNLNGFDRLPLDTLEPDAARKLFRTYFKGECTEEELEALLEEIGYHTLTAELLSKLLDKLNNILSVSELTKILQQKQLDDPDLQEKIWTHHSREERGIYLHLLKAFELTQLTDDEKWLLKQFIVLPVERYAVTTLADFLQQKPLELNKVLNALVAKGWLTFHEDKTFSIHRLIRQVAEYQLYPVFVDVEILMESMIQKMSADAFTSRIAANVTWINYATAVANFFTAEKHEQIATLQDNIAATYRDLGQYEEALGYHQKSLSILESVLDANHPNLAASYNNIALIYRDLGQYEEALGYHQKDLAILESVVDASHPDLATSYHNIALTYRNLGQYAEALGYHQKGLAIRESVLAANHPDLATSYNNIAVTYRDLVQYAKALGYLQKSLAIRESVLAANHPSLAASYNNIATTYCDLGQYAEALGYHEKALAILESVSAANHPDLAASYNNIAATYRDLGQYKEALGYHEKALAILESVLEANHPDLATFYQNIAATYRDLGQKDRAEEYETKAATIIQRRNV